MNKRSILATMVTMDPVTTQKRGKGLLWAGLVLTVIGLGAAVARPTTFYACRAAGDLVSCVVRERPLALVPWRSEFFPQVAAAQGARESRREQTTDSKGREKMQTVVYQSLRLAGPSGGTLHEFSESHTLGAALPVLGRRIEALAKEDVAGPVIGWVSVWPVQLLGTLFGLIGIVLLGGVAVDTFTGRSPRVRMLGRFFEWGLSTLTLLAMCAAWAIALWGAHPPSWLVALLVLGPAP